MVIPGRDQVAKPGIQRHCVKLDFEPASLDGAGGLIDEDLRQSAALLGMPDRGVGLEGRVESAAASR
jgi:hypothetical protein